MATSDPLATYNAKRDFRKTQEPKGTRGKGAGHRFVVQKHAASRLHYDFRLEMDGVLKSWAITKGPSLDPDDKRLAVRTEDHPLSYGGFEGTIPKGEYGGGSVMLWDEGDWEPVAGKSERDLAQGHLHFTLRGQRMKGEWLLVRMKPRSGEKRENWLLRKLDDRYAGGSDDLIARELTSIKTGRTMAEIAADAEGRVSLKGKKGKAWDAAMRKADQAAGRQAKLAGKAEKGRKKGSARSGALPKFRPVQLASLVDAVPAGNGWLHEVKYDGYRALIAVAGDKVRIFTRTGLDWTERYPAIAKAMAERGIASALIDGEIVAFGEDGNPSFAKLQEALQSGSGEVAFFAFDLLALDGKDLAAQPLIERKERLAALIGEGAEGPVRYSDHIIGAGEKLFSALCGAKQEGIIAKQVSAPYRGGRSHSWLKVKCTHREEFVIVGWSPSRSRSRPFASLLLAQNRDGDLVYSGRVGTGFGSAALDDLDTRLKRLSRKTPPLEVPVPAARGAHWVKPELVAEIAYTERTRDGILRHPSFIGLREDKPAKQVRAERAITAVPAGNSVTITHAERVIFPESGATKGDLAEYYRAIGALMLPFAASRPISLVRCPQGRAKQCFFQKHDSGSFGPHVHHIPIKEKDGGVEDYLYIEDLDGLIACVQMGTIEFHGWQSRTDAIEKPDRLVFDLDPDTGLDFADVRNAARDISRTLSDMGLVNFAMLSGGKGIHVIAPLIPDATWETVKDFAQRFAMAIAAQSPERFTASMSKAKRQGRIFIDWLRNQRGSTSVVPYSARARPGASVAAPIGWDELDDYADAKAFSIRDADRLLSRARKLRGWGFCDQPLPAF